MQRSPSPKGAAEKVNEVSNQNKQSAFNINVANFDEDQAMNQDYFERISPVKQGTDNNQYAV